MDIKERGWLRREAVCRSALQHYGYCVLLLISGARSFIFRRLDGVREEESGSGEIKFRVQVFERCNVDRPPDSCFSLCASLSR